MSQFNEAVAQKIDSTVFKGTGDPVSGIFQSHGYSQVFGTGSAHFSMLTFSDIPSIVGKVFATVQDTSRLAWYGHPTPIWQYVRTLTDDNGYPIFDDPRGGGSANGRIYGWPVEFVHQAPSTSAASTSWLAFGDLTGFLIGDRLSTMSLFYDPYGDAYNGNDRFFLFTRWAFANALTNKYGVITTAS
jgi:HK97 family phage major capsid protein